MKCSLICNTLVVKLRLLSLTKHEACVVYQLSHVDQRLSNKLIFYFLLISYTIINWYFSILLTTHEDWTSDCVY